MAISKYDAYAGTAEMRNGATVRVFHMSADELRYVFGRPVPIGHPQYASRRRPGWYWKHDAAPGNTSVGAFSSSRKAMMAAVKANGG